MIDKIAVIDDDEVYQMIVKRFIEKSEAFEQSEYFIQPKLALDHYKQNIENLPAVMLLDINMPLLDGWQFLEELQEYYRDLYEKSKIYIVTSSIAYSDKEKFEDFPKLSGFLSKPITVDKIQEIRACLK